MKNISLKIPEVLDYQIVELANRSKKNKSEFIREILEKFVSLEKQTSSLSKIKDLVGSIEGPNDLSSNKEYLKGLGKK